MGPLKISTTPLLSHHLWPTVGGQPGQGDQGGQVGQGVQVGQGGQLGQGLQLYAISNI